MKLMVKKLRRYTRAHWRILLLLGAGLVAVVALLLFRLGSISGHLAVSEVQQAAFSSSWRHIANNPLNLPFTVVQWLILTAVPHHGSTVTRLASPMFGLLALAMFAYVLRRWYGVRSTVFGLVIFGTCSWFLHASRFAGTDVVYLSAVTSLLALLIAWERHHDQRKVVYLAAVGLSALLYVPGMIWLVVAGVLLQPHLLEHSWLTVKSKLARVLLIVLPLALLSPLFVAFIHTPSLTEAWLGLPHHFGTPHNVVHGLIHSVSFFVYRGPATPELWLARAPILSFFSIVMAVLGLLFYGKHFRATRTRLLFAFFIIGTLLFSLGGPVTISVLVPIVYLLVVAGFGYLLHEWLRVFPRNPLARGVGFGLLSIAVVLTCMYNLKSYFIAWPHSTATEAAFHKHP